MLVAGWFMGLDVKNGWKIFKRDRMKHASPNSAQTESCLAGLLGVQLAGDAWYHGELHKKQFIGDDIRPVALNDIPLSCKVMYVMAALSLLVCCWLRVMILIALV
jgi:adenosylcobinamide-phosphate synthase